MLRTKMLDAKLFKEMADCDVRYQTSDTYSCSVVRMHPMDKTNQPRV